MKASNLVSNPSLRELVNIERRRAVLISRGSRDPEVDQAGLRVGRGCRCLSPHQVPLSPWLTSPSVSLAVPSPSSVGGGGGGDGSADIGRGRERSSPVVVGVSDSGTTRLLPSYRRRFFFINGELASPSSTFTHARLAITLHDARAVS